MVGLVYCIVGIAVVLTVALWVSGIDCMENEFPDYKGEDLFGKDSLDEDEESEKNIENN